MVATFWVLPCRYRRLKTCRRSKSQQKQDKARLTTESGPASSNHSYYKQDQDPEMEVHPEFTMITKPFHGLHLSLNVFVFYTSIIRQRNFFCKGNYRLFGTENRDQVSLVRLKKL